MSDRPRIVAPEGSPLHAALIGVENLERSLDFYRGRLGLQLLEQRTIDSRDLEMHWGLPPGPEAHVIVLAERGCRVGRIVLYDFGARRGPRIRTQPGQRFYGLVNLNHYTVDLELRVRELAAAGFDAWTEPVQHAMEADVGAPTEVMIEGPDGVILNLIELTGGASGSRIAAMRAYVADEYGYNAAGYTPIVTSQHCVPDIERAVRFYQEVLGMGVMIDEILWRDELNRFMGYPAGSRTRAVFMQGNHMFGKLALNHPLDQQFVDLVPRTAPPHAGYFAQSFLVPDLDGALGRAIECDAEIATPAHPFDYPGIGPTRAAVVRNPGGRALQELVESPR